MDILFDVFIESAVAADAIIVEEGHLNLSSGESFTIVPSSGCGSPACGPQHSLVFYPGVVENFTDVVCDVFYEPREGYPFWQKTVIYAVSKDSVSRRLLFECEGDNGPGCYFGGFVFAQAETASASS